MMKQLFKISKLPLKTAQIIHCATKLLTDKNIVNVLLIVRQTTFIDHVSFDEVTQIRL